MSRLLHLLPLLISLLLPGCEGQVGPCAGQDCPTVPGCENDSTVVCDQNSVCLERVCEGVGWICGVNEIGAYVWMRKKAPCDDKNACTTGDICVAGQCVGTPVECKTPPGKACSDGTTLKTYNSSGQCEGGKCVYTPNTTKCAQGCKGGQCVGNPCQGIKCDNPPGPCHKKPGQCKNGSCVHVLNPVGTSCATGDSCYTSGTCDSAGKCSGNKVDCKRAHTSGGTCVQGVCQGFKCNSGWGNCNSKWSDGCETNLTTVNNCGGCGKKCGNVANGSPSCNGGKCVARCNSPYEDCDKKYANGCEIPVGKANSCHKGGLASFSGQTPPCGTPYCGSSSSSKAKNFGTWYCISCTHCQKMPDGKYAWCLTSGGKFSSQRCTGCCNVSSYPQKCSK